MRLAELLKFSDFNLFVVFCCCFFFFVFIERVGGVCEIDDPLPEYIKNFPLPPPPENVK